MHIRQFIQDGCRLTVSADQRDCEFSQSFFRILRLVPGTDQTFFVAIPVAKVKRPSAMQASVVYKYPAAVGELKKKEVFFSGYDEIVPGCIESYDKHDL